MSLISKAFAPYKIFSRDRHLILPSGPPGIRKPGTAGLIWTRHSKHACFRPIQSTNFSNGMRSPRTGAAAGLFVVVFSRLEDGPARSVGGNWPVYRGVLRGSPLEPSGGS